MPLIMTGIKTHEQKIENFHLLWSNNFIYYSIK